MEVNKGLYWARDLHLLIWMKRLREAARGELFWGNTVVIMMGDTKDYGVIRD